MNRQTITGGFYLDSRASRVRNIFLMFVVSVGIATYLVAASASAQTAPSAASQAPKPAAGAPSAAPKISANLLQLMRGIIYPASNVVFAAQSDISKLPPVKDPSTSPNPLTNTYGGWQAVENASLALSEAANLLTLPGRVCSNGKPVPIQRADWLKDVQLLRDAGLEAYKAAKTKNTDNMVDAASTVSDACMACHDVYREKKGGVKDRCTP
jgi:hypothetical protein